MNLLARRRTTHEFWLASALVWMASREKTPAVAARQCYTSPIIPLPLHCYGSSIPTRVLWPFSSSATVLAGQRGPLPWPLYPGGPSTTRILDCILREGLNSRLPGTAPLHAECAARDSLGQQALRPPFMPTSRALELQRPWFGEILESRTTLDSFQR